MSQTYTTRRAAAEAFHRGYCSARRTTTNTSPTIAWKPIWI